MTLQNQADATEDLNLRELLLCLSEYIQRHGASGKPFDVLRGLITLTLERIEKGEDLKISSTSLQVEADGGVVTEKSPGSALSGPWKTLTERTLVDREQGLQKFFSQHGLSHYLWPVKDKSAGGAGNPSMYYFEMRPISSEEDVGTTEPTHSSTMISYIPEITPRPAWWIKKLLEGGYSLEGWRRWLLVGFGLTSFLIIVMFIAMAWIVLVYSDNLSLQTIVTTILSTSLVVWVCYSLISPLVRLLDWRIIKAPESMVSLREHNVLMELVKEAGGNTKRIRLVRYAGICPICSGKVEILEGKKEFPNRFVGRCEESPAEHVFSFDRVTLKGELLR
ncbi:MAG: hypothetical protein KKG03_00530 [Gammaproteobacteria bacterium]|nr:hypothetical protein [Sideroxydans sp.]MBU4150116.1 hypothetical protein [Gammaproteobacteria bacterium]